MSFSLDQYDGALVIEGFENGIGDSPYNGLGNLQNVNIATIPGEVSTSFSTVAQTSGTQVATGSVTSVSGNSFTFTGAGGLETGMAINFTSGGSYSGFSIGTACYWVNISSNTFSLHTTPTNAINNTNTVSVSGSGTANFKVYTMARPRYFVNDAGQSSTISTFCVDSQGLVWTNKYVTTPSSYWIFLGNSVKNMGSSSSNNGITGHLVNDQSHGNGLLYILTAAAHTAVTNGYIFVFSNSSIDYVKDDGQVGWVYGWNPVDATTNNASPYLTPPVGDSNLQGTDAWSHEALVAPDGNAYWCDGDNVAKIFQADLVTPTMFDPATKSTYTYTLYNLLPTSDVAQCLTYLGNNLLIGGNKNAIYVWDRFSNLASSRIMLAENNVQKMVTVNTNTYVFTGNRGRIYITNGSQANLYKKMPDHISGTVEPYYMWGGAVYNKNQLYFGVFATTNSNTTNANYGGLWAINVDNAALRLVNELSYGSYDGYASAVAVNPGTTPQGAGLFIGWASQIINGTITENQFSNNIGKAGMDGTSSTPYSNSTSIVDSDLIPIGTFDKPRNFARIEYLLTKPMVSGENIILQYRLDFSQNYTTIATDSTAGNFTNGFPVNFGNAKWLQVRAVLNSTATNPSYVRLKQIRLAGLAQ